jgi:hypothetical protein
MTCSAAGLAKDSMVRVNASGALIAGKTEGKAVAKPAKPKAFKIEASGVAIEAR